MPSPLAAEAQEADLAEVNRSEVWTIGFLVQLYRAGAIKHIATELNEYLKRIRTSANRHLADVLIGKTKLEDADAATQARFQKLGLNLNRPATRRAVTAPRGVSRRPRRKA